MGPALAEMLMLGAGVGTVWAEAGDAQAARVRPASREREVWKRADCASWCRPHTPSPFQGLLPRGPEGGAPVLEVSGTSARPLSTALISLSSLCPGAVCPEPDPAAARECAGREPAGALHHGGPHQALQLWGPQRCHLQPRHVTGEAPLLWPGRALGHSFPRPGPCEATWHLLDAQCVPIAGILLSSHGKLELLGSPFYRWEN